MRPSFLAIALLGLLLSACGSIVAPTQVTPYAGRTSGGTLVVAPLDGRNTLVIPRLEGEDGAPVQRLYGQYLLEQVALQLRQRTRFDAVATDSFEVSPVVQERKFLREGRLGQGFLFTQYLPPDGTPVRFQNRDADVILFIGNVNVEAARGLLRSGGTSDMPHTIDLVWWDNRAGRIFAFNRVSSRMLVTLPLLPPNTPPNVAIQRVTLDQGFEPILQGLLAGTPFAR